MHRDRCSGLWAQHYFVVCNHKWVGNSYWHEYDKKCLDGRAFLFYVARAFLVWIRRLQLRCEGEIKRRKKKQGRLLSWEYYCWPNDRNYLSRRVNLFGAQDMHACKTCTLRFGDVESKGRMPHLRTPAGYLANSINGLQGLERILLFVLVFISLSR